MQVKDIDIVLKEQPQTWPHQRKPNWHDLEKKRVHADFPAFIQNWKALGLDERVTSNITPLAKSMLEKYRGCILEAPQGRGKTVCALTLGFDLKESFNVVVYGLAGTFDSETAKRFLTATRKLAPLIILDDLHSHSSLHQVADFFESESDRMQHARWLFTTRPTLLPEALTSLFPELIIRPGLADAVEILKRYLWQLRTQTGHDSIVISEALSNCEALVASIYRNLEPPLDLRRLGYFFKAWKPSQQNAVRVAQDVAKIFWQDLGAKPPLSNPAQRAIILPISALAANEVFPAEEFVLTLNHPRAREELEISGIIQKCLLPGQGFSYLLEPSDADDYLSAASLQPWLQGKQTNEYVEMWIKSYLASVPSNLDAALQAIRRNARSMLPALVTSELVKGILAHPSSFELSRFTSTFGVTAESSQQLATQLYDGWLAVQKGETKQKKMESVASHLTRAGIWTIYLFLRALRLGGLAADRATLLDLLDWKSLAENPWEARVSVRALNLLVSELSERPESVRILLESPQMIPRLRKARLKTIVNLLNSLHRMGCRDIASRLIYDARPSLFASKIETGGEHPFAVAHFLRFLDDAPGFDREPVLRSLKTMVNSPRLSLGSLGLILRRVRLNDPKQDIRQTLLPRDQQLKRLLSSADAGDLIEAFRGFPIRNRMKMLELASADWQPILLRSSFGQIASLQNFLRKVAKMLFEKAKKSETQTHEAEAVTRSAQVLQGYSEQIVRNLNSLDWKKWPLHRIGVYRRLLLNALAIDGIHRSRMARGTVGKPAYQACAPETAKKLSTLDILNSLHLEAEFQMAVGCPEEAFNEWGRFFWSVYRADPQSSILSREDMCEAVRRECAKETHPPRTKVLLGGCVSLMRVPCQLRIGEADLVGALQEIKPLLEDHYKPNGSDIEEAFLLLLGMQGAIRLVNGPDSDSGRALAGLQGPALENFFSHFDEEFEKQLCGRVRKKLESLQRSNGEGRV